MKLCKENSYKSLVFSSFLIMKPVKIPTSLNIDPKELEIYEYINTKRVE